MDLKIAAVGLVVGLLIGLTGMGGGAVMTPALILLGWARPVVAVGTDMVWSTLTRGMGAFVHYRQKTVDFALVKRLALGSIPGALAGLVLLSYLHRRGGDTTDKLVVRLLGVALIAVASSLFVRSLRRAPTRGERVLPDRRGPAWLIPVIGLVVGFLVSLTSVGSGSLIVACEVVIYPNTPMRRIVGSDIFHALFLVGISALGHLGIGEVNFRLLGGLLIGSLPGVWIGSRLSAVFPEKVLRPVLATTLMILGYKLL